jgi:Sucrose-6F-phosphate phosphohydrolase
MIMPLLGQHRTRRTAVLLSGSAHFRLMTCVGAALSTSSLPVASIAACVGPMLRFCWLQIEKGGGLPADGVLVCGDSGNDIELFAVPSVRGCMVVNAHPELRKYCEAHASDSIFQVPLQCC